MKYLLVGNPNAGKTSLFNALTGQVQPVGNWSGVTVLDQTGQLEIAGSSVTLVDLPGMYSLDSAYTKQQDELLALDTILNGDADALINVIDGSQLERHLYLTTQLMALKCPMVIVLTMLDKAREKGIHIDIAELSRRLGCAVVDGSRDVGCNGLLAALKQTVQMPIPLKLKLEVEAAEDAELALMNARYQAIHEVVLAVERRDVRPREALTTKLDRLFLNRVLAFPLFLSVIYAVFFLVITVGGFFQEALMQLFEIGLTQYTSIGLQHMGLNAGITAWLVNGVGLGLATTFSFVPVMGVMFFLLACLDESGYMARVAFVMDRIMRALGLPGKAFVPLMIGFGCNVPAVMATRTLDSARDRQLTILMSPFMSCGARLTIYTVFVAAFFPHQGYNIVFSLYLMGILMAVLTGLLLRKTFFKGPTSPLLLELPLYQLPHWRLVFWGAVRKLRLFLWRAGKVIVPVCMLLGLLDAIQVTTTQSLLVWMAQGIQPLFAPMGISSAHWPAVVGLVTGMLAKEVVIGTLNSLSLSMGGIAQLFESGVAAYAYLLFVLLYVPCVSTIAAIKDEAGKRLMWFSILWSTSVAYSVSVLFYQLGTFSAHPRESMAWLLSIGLIFCLLWMRTGYLSGGSRVIRTS